MIEAPAVPVGATYTQDQYNIFWDRYAARDADGVQVEHNIEDMWERVAYAMARTEDGKFGTPDEQNDYADFKDALWDFKFVPGGRILSSAGIGNETMAYNCFVIPMRSRDAGNDSRDAIFETINRMVQIMSRGGGVGINWSTLRPRGAHLSRVNGTSSGSVGWMDVASAAVGEVEQGGTRRGAAMFMLWDWHPDVIEFTQVKKNPLKITNANISVAISDAFMEAVKNDDDWDLRFPDTSDPAYDADWDGDIHAWVAAGRPVVVHKTLKARELWHMICEGAWHNGEPGIVFLERYQKQSTAGRIEKIICVNPCGEQGLGAYSVCNLGAVNVAEFVIGDYFSWDNYKKTIRSAVKFLDNVIDRSHYMEDVPETREQQMKLRRIGLGIMGLADVFADLKIRYGSPQSVKLTESIFKTLKEEALWASTILAKEKGAAPGWEQEMLSKPFLMGLPDDLAYHIEQHGLRNLFLLTQAPTGTTSLLAGVNSGIEPYFALEYERNDRMGRRMVRPRAYEKFLDHAAKTMNFMAEDLNVPDYFVTADQLSVEEHVAIQAAAQKYIDSSISKTVNAPESHTVEDVDRLYMLCYDSGLKGISYFREGCARAVVLSRKPEEKEEKVVVQDHINLASPYMRPDDVYGVTQRVRTKHGHAFVTVNYAEDNGPIEVFVNVGRASSDISEWAEGLGRLISLGLRHGIPREVIAEQLTGVGGYSKMQPSLTHSVAEALLGASMGRVPPTDTQISVSSPVLAPKRGFAPEICSQCGSAAFVREEGCMKCQICGNSKC